MKRERVERVVAVGRRLADPRDPLGRDARVRLPATTGLSPEGVELALSEHLETRPSDAELDQLLSSAGDAPRCWLVLSANVCTAALRAIALGCATAPDVCVRPSRRDPVLAELLVGALASDPGYRAAGGRIELTASVSDAAAGDELHVYGADRTIDALRAAAAPGVRVRGHGTGFGLAVIGAATSLARAAAALARDVVAFDQRGCLSPRIALVEGSAERALELAQHLDAALGALEARVPRGPLGAELALYRATMEALGTTFAGDAHLVGVDPNPRALLLPPAARIVHVAAARADEATALVAPLAPWITALGADDAGGLTTRVAALATAARRSALGHMQRPPLDGPVDRREAWIRRTEAWMA
jgi:hypothetical protein